MENILNWISDNWGKIVALVDKFFTILYEAIN